MNTVRTHTYWMTYNEYKKWSVKRDKQYKLNIDNTLTRTHIIFV
jgi:hypothetical protein